MSKARAFNRSLQPKQVNPLAEIDLPNNSENTNSSQGQYQQQQNQENREDPLLNVTYAQAPVASIVKKLKVIVYLQMIITV